MNVKPKLFSRATVKLTLIYTAILMTISICFSVAVGIAASREAARPFDGGPRQIIFRDDSRADFIPIFQRHVQDINSRLMLALILVNFGMLILGAGLSFLLARWTLRPIEQAMDEQTQFVANASHELRTPLAVMQLENEVALRDKNLSTKKLRLQIQSNLNEIAKLQRLTNYLLEINSCNDATQREECDLSPIIEDAVKQTAARADLKKIKIIHEISPVKIITHADTLRAIIAIILDNAVKYSPENSEIKIAAGASEIIISDNGGGIDEADLPHIFERFYRAEKSRTSEGFGLGLSLAQSLSQKIHAKICAENITKGGEIIGAKFTIKI